MLASSARADEHVRVLKHGDTFALFDRYGDIRRGGEQGLFHEGTRHLSRAELKINGRRPMLLNSSVREDNSLLAVDLTNPDFTEGGKVVLPRGALHLFRGKTIWMGACHEHLRLTHYGGSAIRITLTLEFAADYADIFEVRGWTRQKRGQLSPAKSEGRKIVLGYQGLDGVSRRSVIEFSREPDELAGSRADFTFLLAPGVDTDLYVVVACSERDPPRYEQALHAQESAAREMRDRGAQIRTSNDRFNAWLARSKADLNMLVSETPHGPYPYAGVPWFSTAFGRDGILTALEYLWVDATPAKGVLQFLAAHQAKAESDAQDAQPGKILHETRKGELVNLNEIPFGCYYGSVDSTPLFVMLAGAYFERTRDRELIESLWPNIKLALNWIDQYGDLDHDGFVEYFRVSDRGLSQQGWKDSEDSVFHAGGELAKGPIALVEVQGYVFAAKLAAASLAETLGEAGFACDLRAQAAKLKDAFNHIFWLDDLGTFALALDGEKKVCNVAGSNAGHALHCGIAEPEKARRTAKTLLDDAFFSGWGVRTIRNDQCNYNPMSYHNGSVWPHDNAIIAAGLARYGFTAGTEKILSAMFDASTFIELHRLPELMCGFTRRYGEGPTLYPVACSPQAWSAAAVFYLVQASLGLTVTHEGVVFRRPVLPPFLDWLEITNLRAGDAEMDLLLRRHDRDVTVNVLRRSGESAITVYR